MRAVCLTLPTNRECAATIHALAAEARQAAERFDVQVHLLVLDSSAESDAAAHAEIVAAAAGPNIVTHHLDETRQRRFLREVVDRAGVEKPDLILDLMLPDAVSYGACTNRAFLFAAALGCESVHRRDSDSRYQVLDGRPVFPIEHELAALGLPASRVAERVDATALDAGHWDKPVVLVGGSFVGELSVDIGEIRDLDPQAYHDVVSLWAPADASAEGKRALVEESFTGMGSAPFTEDYSVMAIVDPMRVDMCNIGLHGVHERVPLPPATETIGSDYFLLHVVHDAGLPGVLHNRHVVNFHTAERKTDAGFAAYQTRLVKFFLSMRYLHFVYARMAAAGGELLDERHRVRASAIVEFVRESTRLDVGENVWRLERLADVYRRLGGRYARFAADLRDRQDRLLDEARRDMEDFALLIEAWEPLVRASRSTGAAGR